MTDRLSLTTLANLPAQVARPAVDPREVGIGVVHLGIGAFHRAHQAVYTEDAMAAAGDTGWGIHAVTQRSPRVAEQLAPQDGLYGVLTKGLAAGGSPTADLRVIGAVRDVSFPGEQTGAVLARMADPGTHVATLTVTEKGYRRAGDHLDLDDAGVRADVQALADELRTGRESDAAAGSPIGMLARGLARRARRDATPMTVVTCDNIVQNGTMLAGLVSELLTASGADDVAAWVARHVTFPATMVDRIVPATTDDDRDDARSISGVTDAGLVVAEPFSQWVVEDAFAGPRPAWERAGATITSDVAPFEDAKLRILNGSHSYLAYRGAVLGYRTIAEAVGDPRLRDEVRALVDEDVIPTLTPPPGVDLTDYRDAVLGRFENPALGHTTIQVAMDGSQKLPVRLLGTARDRLAAGSVPHRVARAVAAWMVFVARTADGASGLALDDPLAEQLQSAAAGGGGLVDGLLGVAEVFPPSLAEDERFRSAVGQQVAELTHG
ncbi:mannitol dehydrogenase family protein [Georgenia halophila]|uniref:Mannitol-1-phosphate 5-dehydrogenase n=1 Tax=Georgenia halophila TaxID=620889 RepID=A0ABP8LH16_9MICO